MQLLLSQVGPRLCGIPLEHVAETMRPLPVEPLSGMPAFVLGVSIIRGAPTPVLDTGALLGMEPAQPIRFVTLRIGERRATLAVEAVIGVRTLAADSIGQLPPLLQGAGSNVVTALGTLDKKLLVVLSAAYLVPDITWTAIEPRT